MSKVIYADGIGTCSIIDGVARLELISLVQVEKEKAGARAVGTLAVSLPGLVRFQQDLTKVIDRLVADGVLQRRTSPAGGDVASDDAVVKKN